MDRLATTIRLEASGDELGIRRVHEAAFPGSLEGRLVDDLRRAERLSISIVATIGDEIVGHVAFSPVSVNGTICGLGLAPLAVRPEFQRRGIGVDLAQQGLAECRRIDAGFVVVLGDPAYYERFGFVPAKRWNLSDEYQGGDAFQALELRPGTIPASGGLVQYALEFAIFLPG